MDLISVRSVRHRQKEQTRLDEEDKTSVKEAGKQAGRQAGRYLQA